MAKERLILYGGGYHPDYRPVEIPTGEAPYYGIQFLDGGGLELTLHQREHFVCEKGVYAFFSVPGIDARFRPLPTYGYWDHRYLVFSGSLADAWHKQGFLFITPRALPSGEDWAALLDEIFRLMRSPLPIEQELAKNRLEYLVLRLEQTRTHQPNPPAWLSEVMLYLAHHMTEELDYDAIAKDVFMSARSLRRHFRELTGLSMHAYHLQIKMEHAKRLLIEDPRSIKEIAKRLGYQDVYYFTRQFKQICGIPPGSFRKTHPSAF